jgi:hypothetical protein
MYFLCTVCIESSLRIALRRVLIYDIPYNKKNEEKEHTPSVSKKVIRKRTYNCFMTHLFLDYLEKCIFTLNF